MSDADAAGDRRLAFVIGRQRSGSTVFGRMLGTHPHCLYLGEAFNEENAYSYPRHVVARAALDPTVALPRRAAENFLAYLETCRGLARWEKPAARLVILDMKYDQMPLIGGEWRDMTAPPLLLQLIRDQGWKVIDLRRRDLVRLIVSAYVAVETGTHHRFAAAAAGEPAKMHIDPKQLLGFIRAAQRAYRLVTDQFRRSPNYLEVVYEEMFRPADRFDPGLLARVAAFLGIDDAFDPVPQLGRLLTGDVFDYIANADEVRAYLADHPP